MRNYKRTKITEFEKKWGIKATELAKLEGISPAAIHMRVRNYGTPFQRRNKLTKFEEKYGKMVGELAKEMGYHPVTLGVKENLYGDINVPVKQQYAKTKGKNKTWHTERKWKRMSESTHFTLEDLQ